MAEISSKTVISAVWELHRGDWPTAEEIATYLRVPVEEVRGHLRDLKTARIFKDRRRKGQQVWGPWNDEEFARR